MLVLAKALNPAVTIITGDLTHGKRHSMTDSSGPYESEWVAYRRILAEHGIVDVEGHRLVHWPLIDLRGNQISDEGVAAITQALTVNKGFYKKLTYLNLCFNGFSGEKALGQ